MILEAEGIDQPAKFPGGESGITLGYGCDIGADPKSLEYWRGILTDDQINRLAAAKGKTGGAAAAIARQFSDINVSKADALTRLHEVTACRLRSHSPVRPTRVSISCPRLFWAR